jgi:hypothetical protein
VLSDCLTLGLRCVVIKFILNIQEFSQINHSVPKCPLFLFSQYDPKGFMLVEDLIFEIKNAYLLNVISDILQEYIG